jgi:hypothetical protein
MSDEDMDKEFNRPHELKALSFLYECVGSPPGGAASRLHLLMVGCIAPVHSSLFQVHTGLRESISQLKRNP